MGGGANASSTAEAAYPDYMQEPHAEMLHGSDTFIPNSGKTLVIEVEDVFDDPALGAGNKYTTANAQPEPTGGTDVWLKVEPADAIIPGGSKGWVRPRLGPNQDNVNVTVQSSFTNDANDSYLRVTADESPGGSFSWIDLATASIELIVELSDDVEGVDVRDYSSVEAPFNVFQVLGDVSTYGTGGDANNPFFDDDEADDIVKAVDPASDFATAQAALERAQINVSSLDPAALVPLYAAQALASAKNAESDYEPDYSSADTKLDSLGTLFAALTGGESVTETDGFIDKMNAKFDFITNPTTDFADAATAYTFFKGVVDGLTPTTTPREAFQAARVAVSSWLSLPPEVRGIPEEAIEEAVAAFSRRQDQGTAEEVGRFAGRMFELGSTLGSQFSIGLALIQDGKAARIDDFAAQLRIRSEELKSTENSAFEQIRYQRDMLAAQTATQIMAEVTRLETLKTEAARGAAAAQLAIEDLENRLEFQDANRRSDQATKMVAQMSALQDIRFRAEQALGGLEIQSAQMKDTFQIQRAQIRARLYGAIMGEYAQMATARTQAELQQAQQQLALSQNFLVARQDAVETNLKYKLEHQLYDLNLVKHFNQCLSSIVGAASVEQKSSFERRMMVVDQVVRGVGMAGSIVTGSLSSAVQFLLPFS